MIETQVVIVGAGPAGLGCAALLKQMGIKGKDLIVLERGEIGESFLRWPESMRFITPSFPSNGYHQTDLNAITPDTSPAFNAGKEHLSGKEYAAYLKMVVKHYQIDVTVHTELNKVTSLGPSDGFELQTHNSHIRCQYLIWAGGEYQSPNTQSFTGADLCIHNTRIRSWEALDKGHYVVIGGYESGVDATFNLAKLGHKVTLLECSHDNEQTYDPSKVLSPYTAERMSCIANNTDIDFNGEFEVSAVFKEGDIFVVQSIDGDEIRTPFPPINCTGFEIDLGPVSEFFVYQDNGYPWVSAFDESTKLRNLFLAGPRLFHDPTLLCFIYKFRGRFAAPCSVIGSELELDMSILKHYRQAGMLLEDLSCCQQQECFC
ncbi:NAD(P)/FAD-dependent oxidoreductase [Pseudoalteromonas luteoviolacea]|uniref:NAD(P)/FAD-dependent oxidoreductase n=1 Tax=Pseudoalteromonas luteoviolacea TaxID=43657 RepID=UPI001B368B6D|nr:NAD(P)/FAD-dependent oxidoreductase [Pseudoalteromonas luteoviolacea]MBQ4835508.1 NAD(P)-binding domain-containing protein [Pseudoalteromonas luteoviolacea]